MGQISRPAAAALHQLSDGRAVRPGDRCGGLRNAGSRRCPPRPRFRSTCTYRSAPSCASIAAATPRSRAAMRRSPPMPSSSNARSTLIGARLAGQTVTHLHFGGGTPTMLQPNELKQIMAALHARFRITRATEIAIEIDPRTLSREHVAALADIGVGRASLGVQDFAPRVQEAIGRRQSFEQTARAADRTARRRHRPYQSRSDVRPAAADRGQRHRHRRARALAPTRPDCAVRLRPRAVDEASPKPDPGRYVTGQQRTFCAKPRCRGRIRRRRLSTSRARSFCPRRRSAGRAPARRTAAPQFPRLHDRRDRKPDRLRPLGHRLAAGRLCAERAADDRLSRGDHRRAAGDRARLRGDGGGPACAAASSNG